MGIDKHSVTYINNYCCGRLGGALQCDTDRTKGRLLRTARNYDCGAKLFVESPLLLVAEAPHDQSFNRLRRLARTCGFVHAPLWYWSALCSLTAEDMEECEVTIPRASREQQQQLLMLCHPEVNQSSSDVVEIVRDFWPRLQNKAVLEKKMEKLLAVWLLNCFEHSEDPIGFSTFFLTIISVP